MLASADETGGHAFRRQEVGGKRVRLLDADIIPANGASVRLLPGVRAFACLCDGAGVNGLPVCYPAE